MPSVRDGLGADCDCGKHPVGWALNGVWQTDARVYETHWKNGPGVVLAVHTYEACYVPVKRRSKPEGL